MERDVARLFVALVPPTEVAEDLAAGARAALAGSGFACLPARDLHLTLCFLGGVRAERVADLETALRAELAGTPAFDARIQGAGAFPRPAAARVAWAGLALDGPARAAIEGLVRRSRSASRAVGLEPDERQPVEEFVAHLTLARSRGARSATAAIERLAPSGAWRVDEVRLLESRPQPDGARYLARARFPLATVS